MKWHKKAPDVNRHYFYYLLNQYEEPSTDSEVLTKGVDMAGENHVKLKKVKKKL